MAHSRDKTRRDGRAGDQSGSAQDTHSVKDGQPTGAESSSGTRTAEPGTRTTGRSANLLSILVIRRDDTVDASVAGWAVLVEALRRDRSLHPVHLVSLKETELAEGEDTLLGLSQEFGQVAEDPLVLLIDGEGRIWFRAAGPPDDQRASSLRAAVREAGGNASWLPKRSD